MDHTTVLAIMFTLDLALELAGRPEHAAKVTVKAQRICDIHCPLLR